jgi:hypothetical protein
MTFLMSRRYNPRSRRPSTKRQRPQTLVRGPLLSRVGLNRSLPTCKPSKRLTSTIRTCLRPRVIRSLRVLSKATWQEEEDAQIKSVHSPHRSLNQVKNRLPPSQGSATRFNHPASSKSCKANKRGPQTASKLTAKTS